MVRRRSWLTGFTLMACPGWMRLASRSARAATAPGSSSEIQSATKFLPLFPLRIVVFPGELVLLHIYEARYKQLIKESAETGIAFGIVTVVPGGASSIGTEMKLDSILRTDPSGNMDIATQGIRTFWLESFQRIVEGKLYSGGQVSFNENDPRVEPETQRKLAELYNAMQFAAGKRKTIEAPYPENLSFVIGHHLGLSQAQELQLLTIGAERDRQAYLLQQLLEKR